MKFVDLKSFTQEFLPKGYLLSLLIQLFERVWIGNFPKSLIFGISHYNS